MATASHDTHQRRSPKSCVVPSATQPHPKEPTNPLIKEEPFGLRAQWLHFAKEIEIARLALLHRRIRIRKEALEALQQERTQIMNRCIRRMRRSKGKN